MKRQSSGDANCAKSREIRRKFAPKTSKTSKRKAPKKNPNSPEKDPVFRQFAKQNQKNLILFFNCKKKSKIPTKKTKKDKKKGKKAAKTAPHAPQEPQPPAAAPLRKQVGAEEDQREAEAKTGDSFGSKKGKKKEKKEKKGKRNFPQVPGNSPLFLAKKRKKKPAI